jgi:hypothetical protein
MNAPRNLLIPLSLLGSLAAWAEPGAPKPSKVSFAREVAPIISSKCYHCHGQDEHSRKAELRLDLREEAVKERDGSRAIVPGHPEQSGLIERILSKDKDEVMPPPKEGHAITPAEAETLRKWIAQGAPYEGHWAFRNPTPPVVPALPAAAHARNPVDHFIAQALTTEGLQQNPEADPAILHRRLHLDLLGLPPAPSDIERFAADPSPDRFEKEVDRVLASPHFGERWARPWLDLARYADSTGYGSDQLRLNIWPYRDWVIKALNANRPFDQFSTEQIAGDLLPNATRDQIVATAFHRNTMTQNEGGTDDEEYRVAAVKDRVATTMQSWMGLTAGCAQCHSHKFDPLTQKEYYQLFAIFNQTEDADRPDETPLLPLPTPEQTAKLEALNAQLAALEAETKKPNPEIDREQETWEPLASRSIDWQRPALKSASSRKSTLQADADGILSVVGTPEKVEQYTIQFEAPPTPVSAIRIEVFGDPQATRPNANFRLTDFKAEALAGKSTGSEKPVAVTFSGVSADHSTPNGGPENAVDTNPRSGWTIPVKDNHAAVFQLAKPVSERPIRITLKLDDPLSPLITRFRISFTDASGTVEELPRHIRDILAIDSAQRDPKQRKAVADHFRPKSAVMRDLTKKMDAARKDLAANKPVELPVMREKAGLRKNFILNKGNYLTPGEEVLADLPASFHRSADGPKDRLALARWIFAPDNPLTARVAVNRFWSQIFGLGLVETEEDFGTQGTWPTHPELLDWLAVTFRTPKAEGGLGWDIKALLRLLVTSHTYRQSSLTSETAKRKDPRNLFLSHYSRRRLEAEAIRDQALAVSGLLSEKIGGPSVYPPQPDGLWTIAFRGVEKYPTSRGEDRWRRSLYTIWRRIAPNPTMATFDAPTRETCTLRRVPTNTPLQAFVTLNDPVYFEAAQALARRILRDTPGQSNQERIRYSLVLAIQRPPTQTQIDSLTRLFETELANYRADLESAKKLSSSPELPLPKEADSAELAAWTAVSNVLLNLDGFLTKS